MKSNRAETYLRAFGMSGAQMLSEIDRISAEKGLELRPSAGAKPLRKHEEYKNFSRDVRIDAASMSEYYEIFYCLEVSIRRLIVRTLQDAAGPNWWQSDRVAQGIKDEVKRNKDKGEKAGLTPRSDDEIDFTTFGQLSQLITDNFDLFEPILSSKSATSRVLNQLNLLRAPIAHCCLLADDEKERLELAVRDWFRILS